jgi:hypothetical protein
LASGAASGACRSYDRVAKRLNIASGLLFHHQRAGRAVEAASDWALGRRARERQPLAEERRTGSAPLAGSDDFNRVPSMSGRAIIRGNADVRPPQSARELPKEPNADVDAQTSGRRHRGFPVQLHRRVASRH